MLEAKTISKEYPAPSGALRILTNVDLRLNRGEAAAVIGPSGSGKSTLLYVIGALEPFTRGAWPVPAFHRFDGSVTHAPGNDTVQNWKVEYGDDNLIVPRKESPAHGAELKLPEDIAYDPGLLADTLGKHLKEMAPTADDSSWR